MTMTIDQLIAEAAQLTPAAQRELLLRLFNQDIVAHDPALREHLRQLLDSAAHVDISEHPATDGWSDILAAAAEHRVASEYGDLAYQHDHYLYGTPKKDA